MKRHFASFLHLFIIAILLVMGTFQPQSTVYAAAAMTVDPLTWNVIGLDSNNVSVGPNHFPVGARVCNTSTAGETLTGITANFVWDNTPVPSYINLRPGTLTSIPVTSLSAGTCTDVYFEVEVTRTAAAYDTTRNYHISVTANGGAVTGSTPTPRTLYVEHLVSQNRNAVTDVQYGTSIPTLASVPAGGTMTLMVGNTYFIRLVGYTATQGYEQLESFINIPNTIFQTLSVVTTYTADTSATVSSPNDKAYGDACVWENSPASPNYRSCLSTGKVGGNITVTYQVKILQVPSAPLVNPEPLSTLIYDFSGSSFHYNADYGVSTRFAYIVNASLIKAFSPKTINPGGTSTLTFTVNNPGPDSLTGVNFSDNLPADVTISGSTITYTGCGTPTPASLAVGATSLSFSNITVAGLSTCTIAVSVTASTNATYNNTSGNLFINTSTDTGSFAVDTLVVSSKPNPPTTCTTSTAMATWTLENYTASTATNNGPFAYATKQTDVSAATATYGGITGSSSGIANATTFPTGWNGAPSTTGNTGNSWGISGAWLANNPAAGTEATATTPYFQFQVDASNYGGVGISANYNLQGNWSNSGNWYILYSTNGTTWSYLTSGAWNKANAWQTGLTGATALASNSTVYFRLYAAGGQYSGNPSTTNAIMYLDNISITGCPRPVLPTLSKSFLTSPIARAATSTLRFTLTNPNTATALAGVGFSDTLPTGLLVANPNGLATACTTGALTGGTITAVSGTTTISLNGATLSANANCTISVNVLGNVAGQYTNISGSITSTDTGPNTTSTGYGTSSLTVIAPPVNAKAFTANPIFTSETTLLTFTVNNPNSNTALTNLSFTDNLPAGLVVDTTTTSPATLVTNSCGGTLTANDGATSITLGGINSLSAGATCTITVRVRGATTGLKSNSVQVSSSNGGTGNTATADVLVKNRTPGMSFAKYVSLSATGPWLKSLDVTLPDTVYYLLLVENTGDVPLTNITVTDPTVNPSTCTWNDGDGVQLSTNNAPFNLPIADTTFPINDQHYATCVLGGAAGITAQPGTNTNTASADPAELSPANSSATYTGYQPNLTISKTNNDADSTIVTGGSFNWTIMVANNGNQTANFANGEILMSDSLPGSDAFYGTLPLTINETNGATAPTGTIDCGIASGPTLSCVANGPVTLPPSASFSLTFTVAPTLAGTLANTAVVDPDNHITESNESDNASSNSVYVFAASPTKSIVTTSESSTAGIKVTIGEMVRYRLVTSIPQGTFANVQLVDGLPTGLQFLNDGTATVAFVCNSGAACMTSSTLAGSGLVVNGANSAVSPTFVIPGSAISGGPFVSGTNVTFNVGNITNSDSDTDTEYVVIEFNALVLNENSSVTINQGTNNIDGSNIVNNRQNDVTLQINGTQIGAISPNVTVNIAEPAITAITKSVLPATGPYLPGAALTYTMTFSNVPATNTNAATAFDIVLTDTFDANLTLGLVNISSTQGVSGVATCAGGTTFTTGSSTIGQSVTANISCLDPGRSVTVTVNATIGASIASGTTISNLSGLTYTSLPSAQGNCATTPFTCSGVGASGSGTGERNGSGGSGADNTVLNNYAVTSNTVNTTVTFGSITITKDAVPNDPQDFTFTGTGPNGYDFGGGFSLDDDTDSTLPNTQTFNNLVPGSYSVTEGGLIFLNWSLTGLTCIDPDGGSTTDLGFATATIDLDPGENINCTFTNTFSTPVAIDAVNDSGATVNGAAGGQSFANVLVNDTLNGNPATLANVTLTQVSTTNPNVTLNPTDGSVNVAPGTTAGNYTVTYQICDQVNLTVCDTATVTVPVVVIDAVNDSGATVNGTAGGQSLANVLVNDTLNGNPATLANVTLTQVSTTNPNVTLNPANGSVNVAPGTPAGNYTVTYEICDQVNLTICDIATVTVPVAQQQADLQLTKAVSNTTPLVATNIDFTLTVTNVGPDPATKVQVADQLPSGFTYVSDSTAPSGTTQGIYNDVTGLWDVGTLAVNQTETLTITVTVNISGPYTNYAEITASDQVDPNSNPGNGPQTPDEDDDDSVTVTPRQNNPNLGKSVSGSNQSFTTGSNVAIGEIVEYSVTVNVPPGIFTNARLVDTMERGLSFMSCTSITAQNLTTDVAGSFTGACSNPAVDDAGGGTTVDVGRRATFNFGTLTNASGVDQSITFVYTAVVLDSAANVAGVDLTNSAVWSSDQSGTLSPVTATVNILEPDLSITKTSNVSLVSVGSEVTITLTIQHTGTSQTNAYDVLVTDVLPVELEIVPGTLECVSGAQNADTCTYNTGARTISASWNNFALGGGNGQVTFRVNVVSVPSTGLSNTANVSWTSLPGNVNTPQNTNVFSTERDYDPASQIDVYGASDTLVLNVFGNNNSSGNTLLPATGFAPNVITDLERQEGAYIQTGGLTVEIPSLGISLPIVGVPLKNGEWDVSWLGNQAGWLEGSAFPSWSGNSVLTGHVYGSNGLPGPFVKLNNLKYGDKIIVHAYGRKFTYEVRTNAVVEPNDASVLRHEEKSWLTLVTCKEYDEKNNTYKKRVVVRAVLVSVGWD